jgi:hypothetical protein
MDCHALWRRNSLELLCDLFDAVPITSLHLGSQLNELLPPLLPSVDILAFMTGEGILAVQIREIGLEQFRRVFPILGCLISGVGLPHARQCPEERHKQ